MDLLIETVLLKTKSTLFDLLLRETSQFLCYEILLNMTYVAYKNAIFRERQIWSHCYTVVSYQALFRLSVCKIPAVYLSGAKNVCFCTIRDFGSPTMFLCLVFLILSRSFIAASSFAGKGLTSWLLLVMSIVFCYFPKWYPESSAILDCIVS